MARPLAQTAAVEALTAEHCRAIVAAFRDALDVMGESLNKLSPLERLTTEILWFADQDDGADLVNAATGSDQDRAFDVFSQLPQFQSMTAALKHCAAAIPPKHRIRRALREPCNNLKGLDQTSQDTLFELTVGGWLARRCPDLAFGEPDLTCSIEPLGRVGLACKRPQNRERLRKMIGEGARQIDKTLKQRDHVRELLGSQRHCVTTVLRAPRTIQSVPCFDLDNDFCGADTPPPLPLTSTQLIPPGRETPCRDPPSVRPPALIVLATPT